MVIYPVSTPWSPRTQVLHDNADGCKKRPGELSCRDRGARCLAPSAALSLWWILLGTCHLAASEGLKPEHAAHSVNTFNQHTILATLAALIQRIFHFFWTFPWKIIIVGPLASPASAGSPSGSRREGGRMKSDVIIYHVNTGRWPETRH